MPDKIDEEILDAVSSETRLEILEILEKGKKNPSYLATEVGKNPSTVSEHLEKLIEAGLVEKHENKGRRRVEYSLTKKGRKSVSSGNLVLAISSVVALITGGILSVTGTTENLSSFSSAQASKEGISNLSNHTAGTAPETMTFWQNTDPFTVLGSLLLILGVAGILYWLEKRTGILRKIRKITLEEKILPIKI